MDFSFTEEEKMIKETARNFAQKEIAPYVADYDREERFPLEALKKMGALGMMGGVIPPQYGGAGMTYMAYTLLIEEIATVCQITAAMASTPSGLVGSGIYLYGNEEQKQKYLAPLARGEKFGGSGVTEPHSGTDVAAMETTAKRQGDEYILNGAKTWISGIRFGEWFLTFAQMDKSKRHKGIAAFIVEKGFPGFSTREFKNKVGYRPSSTGELIFEDCRVPSKNRVGQEGQGFAVAMCAVENGRLSVAARALGVMQACLDESLKYAKDRIVFGQPIGRYQLIQSKITDMIVGLESSRYLTYRLAWLKDQGAIRARYESSIAKMYATDTLMKIAVDAVQVHGAYGCSDEYPVGRYFRDAKFFQIVEGTSELHRILIAEQALGYRK
jgi:glutaryl-CoA dehydrogenase (non-decarboxylating)